MGNITPDESGESCLKRRVSVTRQPFPHEETIKTPNAVILAVWPSRSPGPFDHYIDNYRLLFPAADIILLEQSAHRALDQILNGRRDYSPNDENDKVLLHILGDHAATQACELLRLYLTYTGRRLELRGIVFDAAPSPSTLLSSKARPVDMMSLGHMIVSMVLTYIICIFPNLLALKNPAGFSRDHQARIRSDLHDPALVPPSARKCYILPDAGVMFSWPEIRDECPTSSRGAGRDEVWDEARWVGDERDECQMDRKGIDRAGCRWTANQERYWAAIERLVE